MIYIYGEQLEHVQPCHNQLPALLLLDSMSTCTGRMGSVKRHSVYTFVTTVIKLDFAFLAVITCSDPSQCWI